MKLEFSRQSFEKCSNIKFHENPPSGNRVVPADRQTDVKTIVTFRILRRRLKDLRSAHTLHLCVLCETQKKQQLFSHTAVTYLCLNSSRSVFLPRYELNLQIQFRVIRVFKRLIRAQTEPQLTHIHDAPCPPAH
jgi:hypothetical protein